MPIMSTEATGRPTDNEDAQLKVLQRIGKRYHFDWCLGIASNGSCYYGTYKKRTSLVIRLNYKPSRDSYTWKALSWRPRDITHDVDRGEVAADIETAATFAMRIALAHIGHSHD